jgi:hypothetical protein
VFEIWGLKSLVQDSRCGLKDFGCKVGGGRFQVSGPRFRVHGFGSTDIEGAGLLWCRGLSRRRGLLWCFGFRVSGFGNRISDFRFRVSGFVFRVSGFVFRISGFEFRILSACRSSGVEFQDSGSGFEFRVSGSSCGFPV